MTHGMTDPNIADLNELTPEQLRELADKKEQAALHSGLTDGLRAVAAIIESNPELDWQGGMRFTLWCPYELRDDGGAERWMAERAKQIGGEWKRDDDESFFNLRQRHGAVTLELTSPKPTPPVPDERPSGADVTGAVEGGDV